MNDFLLGETMSVYYFLTWRGVCCGLTILHDRPGAMNAAISLARVKLTYSEIAEAVVKFDSSVLSIEQLIGINESLPTSDEAALVSRYTGDKKMLGEVRCSEVMDSYDRNANVFTTV